MIELSYVEQERDKNGRKVRHRDPRKGLSDYTVYVIHTRSVMTQSEMGEAGEYVISLLCAANSDNKIFEKVIRSPIACYAINSVCIKLLLFSSFDEKSVMKALADGRKNLHALNL